MSIADQYMSLFLAEMEEQIELLNECVLALEKSSEDPEVVNKLFRIAHTLKGSSATMGFQMISELTHKMENILDEVRKNQVSISTDLINVLFSCLDQIQIWRDLLANGSDNLGDANELIQKLESLRSNETKPSISNLPQLIITQSLVEQSNDYIDQGWLVGAIVVSIDPECVMQGVRAYQAYTKVKEWGEIIATAPDVQDLSAGDYQGSLLMWVALPTGVESEKLEESIMGITEISKVIIQPWCEELCTMFPNIEVEQLTPVSQIQSSEKAATFENKETSRKINNSNASKSSLNNEPNKTRNVEGNDYLRVEVGKLDTLMNLLGELVIDRARLNQIESELERIHGGETTEALGDVSRHISVITSELQECLLKLRMSPMSVVYGRLPRIIRDLSHQLGKEVNLILQGEETELDRSVIQNIFEPLIHLIRNGLDHGLETPEERIAAGKPSAGELLVKAEQVGGEILITVKDDGRGIDPEIIKQAAVEKGLVSVQQAQATKDVDALQWLFEPGFSTRKEVSEVSGRGVGMDVVKHKVEEMQGRIEIESVIGSGTSFYINLPLTLAVIRALLVDVGGVSYTIPLVNVIETLRIPKKEVYQLGTGPAVVVRGRTIPLIDLLEWCGVETDANDKNPYISVVLVSSGNRQAGLIVSKFIREQEVVVKPLDKYLGRVQGFAGATLLGEGKVSLIYDIPSLLNGVDVFLKGVG